MVTLDRKNFKKCFFKKGFFFSMDALIAVILALSVMALAATYYSNIQHAPQPIYHSSDIAQILSTVQLHELTRPEMVAIIGEIEDQNRTVLEQMLQFQIEGDVQAAQDLAQVTIGSIVPGAYDMGVWIEGYDDPIYASEGSSTSGSTGSHLVSVKQLVSGIEKNKDVEGVTARALLTSFDSQTNTAIVEFGGYEGDGNVTKLVVLPSSLSNVIKVKMELDGGSNFDLFINGNNAGNYNVLAGSRAQSWELGAAQLPFFTAGNNTLVFSFANTTTRFIGGGYLKVDFATSDIVLAQQEDVKRVQLPGIDGLINVYSSFFVPGTIRNLTLRLHYNSGYDVFMTIANRTVYASNISGDQDVVINDTVLRQLVNYGLLTNKTIPIRLGLRNITTTPYGFGGTADSVLVTDTSGSMSECAVYAQPLRCNYYCWSWGGGTTSKSCNVASESQCSGNVCGGSCGFSYGHYLNCSKTKMDVAKEADIEFVNVVLATPGNKVGLVNFGSSTSGSHSLSNVSTSLHSQINAYTPNGGTCICCGVISARSILESQSTGGRARSMLVMTDGEATDDCPLTGVPDHDNDGDSSNDPQDDAIESACRAYTQANITVYTVGFGALSLVAQNTLNLMSACGGGSYVYANLTNVTVIYQGLAQQIVNLSYSSQQLGSTVNFTKTKLYADSYLDVVYDAVNLSTFGRIPVVVESLAFGNNISQGNFTIPSNIVIYDAKIASYSSDKWTHQASILQGTQWPSIFSMAEYNIPYVDLGDPYFVHIPPHLIQPGQNFVRVSTGTTPTNDSGGSVDDRIIYTGGVDLFVNYTGVSDSAQGCSWSVAFEDGTNSTLAVPSAYSGTSQCTYSGATDCGVFTDSINAAVCQLFSQLDVDKNGKLIVKFGPEDLVIETSSVGKIPYLWGPTEVEVRVWR